MRIILNVLGWEICEDCWEIVIVLFQNYHLLMYYLA